MRILFLFLDGVGLGVNDPAVNPFARAEMPHLQRLLGGRRLFAGSAPFEGDRATLLALDASLGVAGLPQSASGQATLLTGHNVPAEIGGHYGPKPNPPIAKTLANGNLFRSLQNAGRKAALLNAYPQGYFDAIRSGRRLHSAIPLALVSAGIPLKSADDLHAGQALAADFTARGWVEHLHLTGTPVLTPEEAGWRLAGLAQNLDFALFEYWLSDYAGHRQDMQSAIELLETFDTVIGSLVTAWDDEEGLILLTSDHGNLEDLSTRRHTNNPIPGLLIGSAEARRTFSEGLHDLTGIAPAIRRAIFE